MREVVFVTRLVTHYRAPFHELVRSRLRATGLKYRLLYSRPTADEAAKADLIPLNWAEEVPVTYLARGGLCWQDLSCAGAAALVILNQESKLLANYAMQLRRPFGGPRLAFFGHGRNFQAPRSDSAAERFKRIWINKVDWWFAYTARSAEIVAQTNFPRSRITVFNNSIDTSAVRQDVAQLRPEELSLMRRRFSGSENIGVFVGGLYGHKRIAFLLAAAQIVRERVPDFNLLVMGGGVDAPLVEAAAREHNWIHALGPRFGREKTQLISLSKVFLMPGLVGLGVLDSFVHRTPMVTTDVAFHSPEIDYLEDGVNGLVVKEADSVDSYASAVVRVLVEDKFRRRLAMNGERAAETYTVENMAERFAAGVESALAAPRYSARARR